MCNARLLRVWRVVRGAEDGAKKDIRFSSTVSVKPRVLAS
jgi:hypothetical protein